jgi:flagellar biosynthesis anti-sigma factor FlgM
MRIDLSQLTPGQVLNEQNTKKVSDQQAGASDALGSVDRTTFTSDSSSVSALVGKAMSSPEIRQDLVSTLKQAVNSGQYKLDPNAIASSMIDEHA